MATNWSAPRRPRVLVLGRPGSGKGTQSARLAARLGVPHVSTGDLFRTAAVQETSLASVVRGYLDAGELVPDDLVVDIVADRLGPAGAARGFVLDGFPRTVAQAERLVELIEPHRVDLAIDLDVPAAVVRRRLAVRRVCDHCGNAIVSTRPAASCGACGGLLTARADDAAAVVTRRLAQYEQVTVPLLAWLAERSLLVRVDGLGAPDEVAARIAAACAEVSVAGSRDLAS